MSERGIGLLIISPMILPNILQNCLIVIFVMNFWMYCLNSMLKEVATIVFTQAIAR